MSWGNLTHNSETLKSIGTAFLGCNLTIFPRLFLFSVYFSKIETHFINNDIKCHVQIFPFMCILYNYFQKRWIKHTVFQPEWTFFSPWTFCFYAVNCLPWRCFFFSILVETRSLLTSHSLELLSTLLDFRGHLSHSVITLTGWHNFRKQSAHASSTNLNPCSYKPREEQHVSTVTHKQHNESQWEISTNWRYINVMIDNINM